VHALRGWPTPLGVAINSLDSTVADNATLNEHVRLQLELLGRQVFEFAVRQRAYRS
jgi:FMN reductase